VDLFCKALDSKRIFRYQQFNSRSVRCSTDIFDLNEFKDPLYYWKRGTQQQDNSVISWLTLTIVLLLIANFLYFLGWCTRGDLDFFVFLDSLHWGRFSSGGESSYRCFCSFNVLFSILLI